MGAPEDEIGAAQATTTEIKAPENVLQVDETCAERMDGAFLSIVLSAALPCLLVIAVTAVLLGVLYGYEVKPDNGWPALRLVQDESQRDIYQTLSSWKKGGDAAVFVKFNPSSLTAIATITGKIIPYLASSIMALVAFFVARRIINISKDEQAHQLLTPHQMSLLIQLLGGNSFGPLKDTVHYHIKHRQKWISPVPHAFSALAAVTALGLVIPAADTWFSTTVTPATVAVTDKITNSSHAQYGRGFVKEENFCLNNWYYDQNNFTIPCNMNNYYYDQDINNTHRWTYSIEGANEIALTVEGLSNTNTVMSWRDPDEPAGIFYKILMDKRSDFTKDFKASTIGMQSHCWPMTKACLPQGNDERYIGANHSFDCGGAYTGELMSNGASLATSLRKTSSVNTGIGFAPDSKLSRIIGNDASDPEFAAFTNPLNFAAWSIGSKIVPAIEVNSNSYTTKWDTDPEIYTDENNFYTWMLQCSSEIYWIDYTWINGSIRSVWPTLAVDGFGGMVSYPFVAGLPISQLCLDYASTRVTKTNSSSQLAEWWAQYFSACALEHLVGTLDPVDNYFEQTRDNAFGATRVPIIPLFVLLGFKLLYCLAVFALAIAAYHYTNPAESQSVKERLTIKGLAATYFTDTPSHQQVAVKNIEQLFDPHPTAPDGVAAEKDAEAAAPPQAKMAVVQTEMGGWKFVKVAASKVYDTVSPIVERQLLGDAAQGTFGSEGKEAGQWISLVRK